jgi:Fur family ferric uptake transcriptional regulator
MGYEVHFILPVGVYIKIIIYIIIHKLADAKICIIIVRMRTSSVDKIIVEILTKEHLHLTALQVFEAIHERLPAVNQSTVYRALERMVSRGLLSVSDMGTGAAVFELLSDGRHHHLVCQQCGGVVTVGDGEVQTFFTTIKEKNQFVVTTNHLILFGTCKTCQRMVRT